MPRRQRHRLRWRVASVTGMLLPMHESCELEIDALAHDGRGIGRLKNPEHPGERGLTVFVTGALPGQLVRCRITRRKTCFAEAECHEVLRPAPDAVAPICPHTEGPGGNQACGGCPLQAMPYDRQLEWKTRLARDALMRIGGLDAGVLAQAWMATVPSPRVAAFRNRMTFAFGTAEGRLVLGQRSRGDAAVVPTPGCALLPRGARELLAEARTAAAESSLAAWRAPERRRRRETRTPGFWRFLTLRQGWLPGEEAPRWWALCLTGPGTARERAAVRALGERLLGAGACRLGGFIHEERAQEDALAAGERRILCLGAHGAETPQAAVMHLPLGGRTFALDAASFFQVNTDAADLLARTVVDMAPTTHGGAMLDVYCGVGAPGQLLAPRITTVLGMENDRRAVAMARRNAAAAGLTGYRSVAGDAGTLLERLAARRSLPDIPGHALPSRWSVALLDPPRGGLGPNALDGLLHLAPEYLLYVSCNPATLARDAARLSARYVLQRITAVDLFPHTPHLECCSLWRRR